MKNILIILLMVFMGLSLSAGHDIRLNQLGYYPGAVKRFVVVDSSADTFEVQNLEGKILYKGKLMDRGYWQAAKEKVKRGDFSSFREPGQYRIFVKDKGKSHEFEIKKHLYKEVLGAALKSYYFQRASMELEEAYAGQWKRPMGHPDNRCFYHPTSGRSTGFNISPGGWYDAGDYNKYIVNAGVTVCTLLSLHELLPGVIDDQTPRIPESGNGIDNLLDELRYELDWVLTMQDDDGGVFLKITSPKFTGFIMPHQDTSQRWVVGKTTAAALNFTAMTAQAARVFRDTDKPFANRCLAAAKRAWQWAIKNPARFYRNPKDINTGEYHDANLRQELFWAASELLITTGENQYLSNVEIHINKVINEKKANWNNAVDELGCFSLASVKNYQSGQIFSHKVTQSFTKEKNRYLEMLKKKAVSVILRLADNILKEIQTIPYGIPHSEFVWGSNGDMAYDGMILAYAYHHTGKRKYLEGVVETVDYLFGKNAVGYSFVTGFGDKTPRNIHHRPSGADGITDPIPGFLVGGPNQERQDSIEKNSYGVKYTFKEAAKSYLDLTKSFASNEVCINWNAPLIFLLGFLETHAN